MPSPSQNQHSSNQFSYFPAMGKIEPGVLTKTQPTSLNNRIAENGFNSVFEEQIDEAGWTNISKRESGGHLGHDDSTPQPSHKLHQPQHQNSSSSAATAPEIPPSQILPYPRPYSVPNNNSEWSSAAVTPTATDSITTLSAKSLPTIDRTSSASLPLPSQIPFYALPKIGSRSGVAAGAGGATDSHRAGLGSLVGDVARSSTAELEEDTEGQRPPIKSSDSGSSGSSGSLPSASSVSYSRTANGRISPTISQPQPSSSNTATRPSSHPSNSCTSYRYQPRTSYPSESSSLGAATALRRSVPTMSSSIFPPPEPPTILPSPPLPPPTYGSVSTRFSSSSSCSTYAGSSCASVDTALTTPSASELACDSSVSSSIPSYQSPSHPMRPPASEPPYAPFLSHAPPPADSWIEVETTPSEYRLNVKLPGFQRDGITLATKKRRILHVVADSWGSGGGHFERRISFGYDADLVHVRAEFDGDMLRVVVPRRIQPLVGAGAGAGMGYAM